MEEKNIVENTENKVDDIAKGYFKQGLNCAESVLLAFMDTHEIDLPKEAITMATGFGGGIGHTKNMCGAISGAVMALGLAKGRQNPLEKETPRDRALELRQVYPSFAEIVKEVEEKYGTLICAEMSAPHGDFDGKERKRSCQDIIGFCASIASKLADENME